MYLLLIIYVYLFFVGNNTQKLRIRTFPAIYRDTRYRLLGISYDTLSWMLSSKPQYLSRLSCLRMGVER